MLTDIPGLKTPVTCPKCSYQWRYRGKLQMVSCPNCGGKFNRLKVAK